MQPKSAHLDLMNRWLRYDNYFRLDEVFAANGWRNVAIYGGGYLGQMLYEKLYGTDIAVRCITDRDPDLKFPYNVDVFMPERFFELQIEVDAIIIAVVGYYSISEIISILRPHVTSPIISLDSLLVDIDALESLCKMAKIFEQTNVHLFLIDISYPVANIKNPSEREILLKLYYQSGCGIFANPSESKFKMKALWSYFDDLPNCTEKYISEIYTFKPFKHTEKHGIQYLLDMESEYYNIINGSRCTTDNPNNFDNTIHFFGNCFAFGAFAEDRYTIASQLQRIINSSSLYNKTFSVANHPNAGTNIELINRMEHTIFTDGDIIVSISLNLEHYRYYIDSNAVHFFRFDPIFERPHDYGEIFFDGLHTNHRGYRLIADKIYSILSDHFNNPDAIIIGEEKARTQCNPIKPFPPQKRSIESGNANTQQTTNPSLGDYIAYLQDEKVTCQGTIGSIVMNCNPFTLGHRFLIEEAKKGCDFLYIFVVEEDKSFFSFEDRLMLVKDGTNDLENVKVLRGGSFIISSMTLPEYFVKESQRDVVINASKDFGIFAESIAPVLNISKRFVGEEPLDPITNQYNSAMLDVLPRSGIEAVEIPRKPKSDGTPISASLVRKLLKDKDFEAISQIVPKTTLDYLKKTHT